MKVIRWTEDWAAFVQCVAVDFGAGLDDAAVTARYAGHPVAWVGEVAAKRLNDDRPGVQMTMPAVHATLPDRRRTTVDYLFLHLQDDDVEHWQEISVGQTVRFATRIIVANGPFAGIQWIDVGDNRGVISLGTSGARPAKES